jgi:hypothetical protein
MVPGGLAQRRERDTIRGGARFQWPTVATSFHAADPTVDPNHDADIRIGQRGSEAAVPILISGMRSQVDARANRHLGSFLADRRSEAPACQN